MLREKTPAKPQTAATPERLAAEIAAEVISSLATFEDGSERDEVEIGIQNVASALAAANDTDLDSQEKHFFLMRAGYLVGVQVGLLLRNVGGAR